MQIIVLPCLEVPKPTPLAKRASVYHATPYLRSKKTAFIGTITTTTEHGGAEPEYSNTLRIRHAT